MTFCLVISSYAFFGPRAEEDGEVKDRLSAFLDTWMDKSPEDFCEQAELFPLRYMKAYLSVFLPDSDLTGRVNKHLEEQAQDSQAIGRMRKTQIWGDTHPQMQGFSGYKLAGKTANREPAPTCAPDPDSTKTTRSFCDTCVDAAPCGSSSQPAHLTPAVEHVSQHIYRYSVTFRYLRIATVGPSI